jgi:hypothetical protein
MAGLAARTAALMGFVVCVAFAQALSSDPLPSSRGDFAPIAKGGFTFTVDGAFFADRMRTRYPNLVANPLGSSRNDYAWSMGWFDGRLYVGTNRDPFCLFDYSWDPECFGPDGMPGEDQRAEIWRYTPSRLTARGDWGLSGTWERVYLSPDIFPGLQFLGGLFGLSLTEYGVPEDFPRDFGYRSMSVCDAGDGVERLYVGTVGVPGYVLVHEGGAAPFLRTSTIGLNASILDVRDGIADLGYRSLTCFKGRLWTSPAVTLGEVDASAHPVVLMNPNPANHAPWETVVDVKGVLEDGSADPHAHPLANPNNVGIFQIEAVGDYLYLSVANRTEGFELWRGDGRNCSPPWEGNSHCRIRWSKVIESGGGRPADRIGRRKTTAVDNAGATLGVFGDDLYIGATESVFSAFTYAELLRVPNANRRGPVSWELLVGWPRRDWAARLDSDLKSFTCANPGDMANEAPAFWDDFRDLFSTDNDLTKLDDDGLVDDCLPLSGMGPGFGLDPDTGLPHPLAVGPLSYFWRFAEHGGELFIGTLDTLGDSMPFNEDGADLWRTANGVDFTIVNRDGLGHSGNYGFRTLLSVPGLGLVVGSANTDSEAEGGGAQVFIGTTAPGPLVPPHVDTGGDQVVFDTDRDGEVTATLDGSGSIDGFDGIGGEVSCEWFQGDLAVQCRDLGRALHQSTLLSNECVFETGPLASQAGDQDVADYTFTLRVTGGDGLYNCATATVSASYKQAPTVELEPSVPLLLDKPRTLWGGGGEGPPANLRLVDFDGDGQESYSVIGHCDDLDGDALVKCEFQVRDAGNILTDQTNCPAGTPGQCIVSATVTTARSDRAVTFDGGALGLEMALVVENSQGYTDEYRWESYVQSAVDDPEANDAPVCRSVALGMRSDASPLAIDPAAALADGWPICVDPEGTAMTYQLEDGCLDGCGPTGGEVVVIDDGTRIEYTPDTGTLVDVFEFLARDSNPDDAERSLAAAIRVYVDDAAPTVEIVGTSAEGDQCAAGGECIGGAASDGQSGVATVEVRIVRERDGFSWDGSGFVAGETWVKAEGKTAWQVGFDVQGDVAYRVMAIALDLAGNASAPVERSVTWYDDAPASPADVDSSQDRRTDPGLASCWAAGRFGERRREVDGTVAVAERAPVERVGVRPGERVPAAAGGDAGCVARDRAGGVPLAEGPRP